MKKRKNTLVVLAMVYVMMASCNNGDENMVAAPTAVVENRQTATLPSATTTPVTVNPAEPKYDLSCWKPAQTFDNDSNLEGSLIYFDNSVTEILELDLNSNHNKILTDNRLFVVPGFSTDGGALVIGEGNYQYKLITQDKMVTFPAPEDSYNPIIMPTGQILFGTGAASKNFTEGSGTTDKYYLYLSQKGEWVSQSVFLPMYYEVSANPAPSFIEYSPNLGYVIYSARDQGKDTTILLNTTENKIVWEGPDLAPNKAMPPLPRPMWLPDSSTVTVALGGDHRDFFNILPNGDAVQLTHLNQTINAEYALRTASWSPNGRYLAFTVDFFLNPSVQSKDDQLFIFDVKSNKLINTCLSLNIFSWPIWSPDGNHFAVNSDGNPNISIFDMPSEATVEVPIQSNSSNMNLLGWVTWKIP